MTAAMCALIANQVKLVSLRAAFRMPPTPLLFRTLPPHRIKEPLQPSKIPLSSSSFKADIRYAYYHLRLPAEDKMRLAFYVWCCLHVLLCLN